MIKDPDNFSRTVADTAIRLAKALDALSRPMKPVPIDAAKAIAEEYGYDQVIIYARRVGEVPEPCGEHMTTYGINKDHCAAAAQIGDHLKYKVMGWTKDCPSCGLPDPDNNPYCFCKET